MNREEKIEILQTQKKAIIKNYDYWNDIQQDKNEVYFQAYDLLLQLLQLPPRTIEILKYLKQFTDDTEVFYQAISDEESIEAIRDLLSIFGRELEELQAGGELEHRVHKDL